MLRVASALAFVAMVVYMAFYVADRFVDPVQTALVVTASMNDSSTISGLVVRDELVLTSDAPYINVVVSDGEKVGAGQTVAVVYGSEDALERASRITSLEEEIEEVDAALSSSAGVSARRSRDASVYDAILDLSASLRNENFAGVDTRQNTLAGLVFRTEVTNVTEEYRQSLLTRYRELLSTASGDTGEIDVEKSGTFTLVVDGYEDVSPAVARDLSPSGLRALLAEEHAPAEGAIGKLVTSYKWYYAAIVGRADASRLVAGRTLRLSFGRYYGDFVTATVEYVGQAEGNEQLILFSMDKGFSDLLAVRAVSAELVYSEYTGLRVPLRGLYRYYAGYLSEEDGSRVSEGDTVTLALGGAEYTATVTDVGGLNRYGDLPPGVESGSEQDTRPKHRLVVFCWPYADEPAPDFSAGGGMVTTADGSVLYAENYYEYDRSIDRMCVFAMTGLQAERKKVTLIYAGEEYALVSSEGSDALREGNELIVQAAGLYNGKVYR